MCRPSPHFTTAFATRKAATTRSTLELRESGKCLGRVDRTGQHDGPDGEQHRRDERERVQDDRHDGRGEHGEEMPPSWVNPAGMGANQMPAASARHRSFLIGLSYAAVVIGFALPTTGPDAPGP